MEVFVIRALHASTKLFAKSNNKIEYIFYGI